MRQISKENKIITRLNRKNVEINESLPIKIIQFGEGNFLRAFVEFAFQKLNQEANFNAGIAVVQPIEKGMIDMLNDQDGLYTLFLKGVRKGKIIEHKELINNIVKGINPYQNFQKYIDLAKEEELQFIISNTTEAGISYVESDTISMQPPSSFPAKLTVLLYERFKYFKGASDKALTIIPCELINHNAEQLKEIILKYASNWNLETEFINWVNIDCSFHSTLVDRIVPGYPKDEIEIYNSQLNYKDNLIVAAEVFLLWVIEGGDDLKKKLPFDKTDLDVKIVKDMQPYRTRKVRILNGAHTSMVPVSLLFGNETVQQTINNPFTGNFVNKTIFEEINDVLPLDKSELYSFAEDVLDRFRNPFIKHKLADIALNSVSKFKVRVLPTLQEYVEKNNKLPTHLTFAFACLIRFYKGTWYGKSLPINDSQEILEIFQKIWTLNDTNLVAKAVLSETSFWDEDLTKIENLTAAITVALNEIEANGIEQGFTNFSIIY